MPSVTIDDADLAALRIQLAQAESYCDKFSAEIERLQEAKRRALAVADERVKENVALRAALADIHKIANIAPADDQFGSLAVRMEKVWLLSRGYEQSPAGDAK